MTALAREGHPGFPSSRVMGQAGMLDTARFTNFVAERLDVPVGSVKTLTLGSHGDTMVPVPSACTRRRQAAGRPAGRRPDIEALVRRTRNWRLGEIVALLKTGSAYYAPSAAAARMARAVAEDTGATMPVCAWVDGQYGISGVYLGVEAEIGRAGIRRVVERDLTESELAALRTAAEAVRAKQADVASIWTGPQPVPWSGKRPTWVLKHRRSTDDAGRLANSRLARWAGQGKDRAWLGRRRKSGIAVLLPRTRMVACAPI